MMQRDNFNICLNLQCGVEQDHHIGGLIISESGRMVATAVILLTNKNSMNYEKNIVYCTKVMKIYKYTEEETTYNIFRTFEK